MRFSTTLPLLALFSLAAAQTIAEDVAKIPACAKPCLDAAIKDAGCALTDFACQCGSKKNDITAGATGCVSTSCQANDITTTLTVTTQICELVAKGDTGAPASSSAAPVSTSAAPTSSASSAAASGASSVVSEVSSAVSSVASLVSSVAGGASSVAASLTSAAGTGASATSAAPSSSSKAAATAKSWNIGAGVVGAAAVVAGLL